jgi:tRNA dimethylallyltransferase
VKSKAYFLLGATASGKSEVAHIIARRRSLPLLSIDSMQLYTGLNVGTAKPSMSEREGIRYYGLDIASPDMDFSVAQFCEYVRGILADIGEELIVCGGTGLYAKVLTERLEEGPKPDPELRKKWERIVSEGGVELLKDEVRSVSTRVFESLKDKDNPRRLIRALEWARSGKQLPETWREGSGSVLTGLYMPVEALRAKIDIRAEEMFSNGLIEEVRGLVAKYGGLSRTASQAIGYAEALAVIDGSMSQEQAIERTKIRTRQLAKKQRTWFRNQVEVDWVAADSSSSPEELADSVEASWRKNGAAEIVL